MKPKIDEARERVLALQTEIRTLAEKAKAAEVDEKAEKLSEDEETRFEAAMGEFESARDELAPLEERAQKLAAVEALKVAQASGGDPDSDRVPNQINRQSPFAVDLERSKPSERRDAALQWVEDRTKGSRAALNERQADHLDGLLRAGRSLNLNADYIAQRALLTDTDAYKDAFFKGVTETDPQFTPEESRAIMAFRQMERRAAGEGTPSAGGYGVPILIDPSIILTSGALDAPILSVARVVTITTDQWKGVTSAGLTFEFTAEAAAVADKTPTLAQPSIPVYRADGFIPYSFEIGQDYPGFAEEMSGLLSQGYINCIAVATMTGAGTTNNPTGIFTALQASGGKCADGTSGTAVTVTTLGEYSGSDIRKAWGSLPELFRQHASWVMNVTQEEQIRALGNNLALADFTVDLSDPDGDRLTGRPVILSDYAPSYTNTTATTNQFMVVGDFSNYMIVQRAGMVVEQVNHLFSTSTGYPTGQRGWLAWSRIGANALSGNPFRTLSNGG